MKIHKCGQTTQTEHLFARTVKTKVENGVSRVSADE